MKTETIRYSKKDIEEILVLTTVKNAGDSCEIVQVFTHTNGVNIEIMKEGATNEYDS